MDYLSNRIADFYVKKNIIQPEEKDVYKCGVSLILNDIVTFCLILIISALIWNIRLAIEFLIVFCLTRVYCGGYHAPKAYLCRLTMLLTFICVSIASNLLKNATDITLYMLALVSFLILLPIAPVKHPNKKLTDELIKKGRKNTFLLLIVFIICAYIIFNFISKQDGMTIILTLCSVAIFAIIGVFTNERRCKNEEVDK